MYTDFDLHAFFGCSVNIYAQQVHVWYVCVCVCVCVFVQLCLCVCVDVCAAVFVLFFVVFLCVYT